MMVGTDPIDRLCQIRDTLRVAWMALGIKEADREMQAICEVLDVATNDLHRVIEDMSGKELGLGVK